MTLEEIARELAVSKSTVSRALSGKGRIGEETREKILAFVRQQEEAKQREEGKRSASRNLGLVLPADTYAKSYPYFMECILGVCEVAALQDYFVITMVQSSWDIAEIQKLVEREEIAGIILTRAQDNDPVLRYLTQIGFPVGMTGLCEYEDVIQVDIDNESAAFRLTSLLANMGYHRFALVVEELSNHVDRSRYEGFWNGILQSGLKRSKQAVYTGKFRKEMTDSVIEDMISRKVECIICGDDVLCAWFMSELNEKGYRIPKDIAIASLYNSPFLDILHPAVTVVNVSARAMGHVIGRELIQFLEGREYRKKTMLDYELLIRSSTELR